MRRKNSVDGWVFDFVDTLLVASPWQAASTQTVLFSRNAENFQFLFFSQNKKKSLFFLGGKKMKNLLEYFQSSKLIN